ncbi:hypothetical protein [Vibrio harveyi]
MFKYILVFIAGVVHAKFTMFIGVERNWLTVLIDVLARCCHVGQC